MKILVFSDSHGNVNSIRKALFAHKSTVDLVIFLGDGVYDIEAIKADYPELSFFVVRGNCDFMCADVPKESVLDLDGVRFLVCHGHTYNVKGSLDPIISSALERDVDVVLFGHTHSPLNTSHAGERRIKLFNPGSIGLSLSYGVINIVKGVVVAGHGSVTP